MKTRYFIILLICTTGMLFCCKDSGTDPDNNGNDTTSHDFSWKVDSLRHQGSLFLDVAFINENDIWIVGDIRTDETGSQDSNGFVIDPYNAMHWNGDDWMYYRLKSRSFTGQLVDVRIQSIFAFAPNDIWMCSISNSYLHWDGLEWHSEYVDQSNGLFNKIWGSSSDNLYIVGNNGNISHYDGLNWQFLESFTDIELTDVYGSPDGRVVWTCGYTVDGSVLLKIQDLQVEKIYEEFDNLVDISNDSLSTSLTSLWTNSNEEVYVISPGGMYEVKSTSTGEAKRIWYSGGYAPGFPRIIRGVWGNDIFVGGDFSFLAHYNGSSWMSYIHQTDRIRHRAMSIRERKAIIVGEDLNTDEAVIIRNYK